MPLHNWLRGIWRAHRNGLNRGHGLAASPGISPEALESRCLLSGMPPGEPIEVGGEAWAVSVTTPLEAQPALPAMPTSDSWYGAVVNANNYITSPYHRQNLSPKLSLITDVNAVSRATWIQTMAALRTSLPQALIGTYHSARDSQRVGTFPSYPPRAVPREGLTDSQILITDPTYPNIDIVDYTQPEARRYLVDHIVQNVTRIGGPLVFLDNVSHRENGFPIAWATSMDLVRELSTSFHAVGMRAIINAAVVPGVTSMLSVNQLLATGVDGVSFEMGFHPNIRNSAARIETAMQQYRKMLDAGLTVILIPIATATG